MISYLFIFQKNVYMRGYPYLLIMHPNKIDMDNHACTHSFGR